jgi:hypothetical protein
MTGSAKQSSFREESRIWREKLDCFIASAPRNDESITIRT